MDFRTHCLALCDALHAHHELDRLALELEAHLDHEEEHLVPVLNRMTTLPDDV